MEAGRGGSPQAAAALETLCRSYWYPLYVYVRRKGQTPHDAQDLTQSFFAHLLERNFFGDLRREKGRFRTFLIASLNNFLRDARDHGQAKKRGGGQTILSLDADPERRYLLEPVTERTAEADFDRRWALTVLERAMARLREEFAGQGKAGQFERLRVFLCGEAASGDYESVAAAFGVTSAAVAVLVHRIRKRYYLFLRAEIAKTVASPLDVDGELNYLIDLLSS